MTPKFVPQISLGNIISVIAAIVAAAGMVFIMEARSQSNSAAIDELKRRITGQEVRTQMMEVEIARADERNKSIFDLLSKIDIRLERIESRP